MIFYGLLMAAGLFGGFLGGLIGIGGGIIFVMILPEALLYVGVPEPELPQYVIANSLFATMFSAIASSITNYRKKNFFPEPVLMIASSAIILSFLVVKYLVNTPFYDKTKFNIIIIVMLVYMLARTLMSTRGKTLVTKSVESLTNTQLWLIGCLGGIVSPLSGLGGGIIIIPILNSALKIPVIVANSISLGVIGLVSFSVTISNVLISPRLPFNYYSVGYIVFPVALALSAGVVFGTTHGINVSRKLPPKVVSYIFAAFMLIVILKKAYELYQLY